jgi:hypothetical protein
MSKVSSPVVVQFKNQSDPAFQKPDHDPHGESPAAAAHSSSSCDECRTSGLVPTATLELASGHVDGVEREVLCEDCGDS